MTYKYRGKSGNTWFFGKLAHLNGEAIREIIITGVNGLWEFEWEPVERKSLGQFTGEYDDVGFYELSKEKQAAWLKSGKTAKEWNGYEIFEGDILEIAEDGDPSDPDKYLTSVWFEKGAFLVDIKGQDYDVQSIGYAKEEWHAYNQCCRVVGNIFDAPELLEEQK